jgi:hypothetical protein
MKRSIKNILFGDIGISEYSTITIADKIREAVYLKTKNLAINISENHWVLCLNPIVFGIWIEKKEQGEEINNNASLKIYFCSSADEKRIKQNAVAIVTLDLLDKIEETNGTLFLMKLKSSKIYHTSFFKTFILFYKYYKKPSLSFRQFKALVSAYSYPRKVRVISFKKDDYYNIFPMDLVGEIAACNKYIFGLRHTNITLEKIIETKKILASEVSFKQKDIIYQLGKHHGAWPPSILSLPFKTMLSRQFKFYVPEWAESYKEIKIIKTINLGSHMLLWGEVVNEEKLKEHSSNLYHVHFLQYFHQHAHGFNYPLV